LTKAWGLTSFTVRAVEAAVSAGASVAILSSRRRLQEGGRWVRAAAAARARVLWRRRAGAQGGGIYTGEEMGYGPCDADWADWASWG
jgi:hypothetical protein